MHHLSIRDVSFLSLIHLDLYIHPVPEFVLYIYSLSQVQYTRCTDSYCYLTRPASEHV